MNYEDNTKLAIIDAHIHLDQYDKAEQRTNHRLFGAPIL